MSKYTFRLRTSNKIFQHVIFMSTYSMLSQKTWDNDFKFALWFLNQIYKFSSLIILTPFHSKECWKVITDMKNRRNADPTPFLTCHYKFNQSNISLKKRRGYSFFFKTVLELLHSRRAWICTNVVTPQCLLAGEHYSVPSTTAHVAGCCWDTVYTSKDGEKKYP